MKYPGCLAQSVILGSRSEVLSSETGNDALDTLMQLLFSHSLKYILEYESTMKY